MNKLISEIEKIDLKLIKKNKEKIKNEIIETPVSRVASSYLDRLLPNSEIFMKLELFQHTGTFKARGALTVANEIEKEKRKFGITAASAGNHAIAASWAAYKLGMSAKVVMRSTANPYRISQAKMHKAEIIIVDEIDEVFKTANELVDKELRTFIHPFEGLNTTLGTSGVGLEFIESVPNLDAVIVSIGGGGLISGVAAAVKLVNPDCKVFGVEPIGADTMYKSFKKGKTIQNVKINSIVDSLSPPMTLPFSFAVCKKFIDEIVTVSDDEICAAMVILQEETKLAVEPAAAATLSALIGPLRDKLCNMKIGLLMCGANIDTISYSKLIESGYKYINNNKSLF